jgi:hypothetical protein
MTGAEQQDVSHRRSQNPSSSVCLPPRWAHLCDTLDLLSPFCISPEPLLARNPADSKSQDQEHVLCATGFCPSPSWRLKKIGCFVFKPLGFPVIYRLVLVSCTFYGKPPTKIPPFTHKAHPCPFSDLTLILCLFASTIQCVLQIFSTNPWDL